MRPSDPAGFFPDERVLVHYGPDWLLLILDRMNDDERLQFLLLIWRASWHLRNDSLFGSGKSPIQASVVFLQGLWESVVQIRSNGAVDSKGKRPALIHNSIPREIDMCKQSETKWQAPPSGWAKINVDGAFVSQTSKGSVGIVIRDHECNVLLSAWSVMRHCTSAEEVEATACRDVMVLIKLANEWIKMPLILETDCANVSSVLKATEEDRSQLWNIFQEARLALALSHKYQIVSVPIRPRYGVPRPQGVCLSCWLWIVIMLT